MTTETLTSAANVTVTERAARRISEIVAADAGKSMLRVSVEGGGCSGFSYHFDLVEGSAPDDIVIERAGAKVLIDPVSLEYMARIRDRLRRRTDRRLVQDPEPQRCLFMRLRHKLRALDLANTKSS